MIDTEIMVGGKVLGKYDLCKDLPMFDLDYTFRNLDSPADIVLCFTDLTSIPRITECYERNMHVVLTLRDLSYGVSSSSDIYTDIKFPRIKDIMTIKSLSGDIILSAETYAPIKSDQSIGATLWFDLDDEEYSKGNIKIIYGSIRFYYPKALFGNNVTTSDYNKVVAAVYASLY